MKLIREANKKTTVRISQKEWTDIGKKAGFFNQTETMELGPSPADESCAQLGTEEYTKWGRIELKAYLNQLKRAFPDMPPELRLKIKANSHDFGTYHEVAVTYPMDNDEAMNYAFKMENELPEHWDEQAKTELRNQGYPI